MFLGNRLIFKLIA